MLHISFIKIFRILPRTSYLQPVLYGGKRADVLWIQSERKLSGFQSDCLNYLVICRLPQQSALGKVAECYICPLIYKKFRALYP